MTLALLQATDHDLIALARKGSEKAYRELLGRYQRPVFSLVYRMVRDREQAEDIAQETFVKVFNHLGSYNPKYKFSSWIFKIASNLAIDHLRKKEPETVSLDGSRNAITDEQMEATRITVVSQRRESRGVPGGEGAGRGDRAGDRPAACESTAPRSSSATWRDGRTKRSRRSWMCPSAR